MSEQNIEHAMSMAEIDSTLPSTVPVAGRDTYGTPLFKTPLNSWLSNIYQEYAIDSFDYSVTSTPETPLYNRLINPIPVGEQSSLPWAVWYLTNYQAYSCEYNIILEIVKHSAHRGAIAVSTTLDEPLENNSSSYFLPTQVWDISGDTENSYIYKIPNIFGLGMRMAIDNARNINFPTDQVIPKFSFNLCHLSIFATTPLVASTMLPSTVTVIVKLQIVPGSLKVAHPVLPSYHRFRRGGTLPTWNNV